MERGNDPRIKKGGNLKVGQEIEVGTMQFKWVGEGLPMPGHSGHFLKPEKGQQVLVFCKLRKDGEKFAIFPNRMQLVEQEKKKGWRPRPKACKASRSKKWPPW